MKKLFIVLVCFQCSIVQAQEQTAIDTLQAKILDEIIVRGYDQNRQLREVAAPVSLINQQQFQRSGPLSIVAAVNTAPGVRMEERSPGSYRLNIRGSSLRSPFGVRNVKVYWNGIPFTDPGGNTYLNQFSFYNFSSIEILKGPGSSLYGAGTGGVMLINSLPDTKGHQLSLNYSAGSFNSKNINVSAVTGDDSYKNLISYTHQSSDGYREHSAMKRDVVSWESRIVASEKHSLSTHVLFGNLYYETPGGLTKAQYNANPRSARPAGGGFPGAIQNQAAIYQKTFWAGINHQYRFNHHFENTTSVYGAFSQVRNPAIRNYERRLEPNFGGRTTFSYATNLKKTTIKILAGGELQQGYATIKVYKNKQGNIDSLQTDDEVNNRLASVFMQAEAILPKGWIVTAGMSLNTTAVTFNRLSVVPSFQYNTRFNNELAPRVSLLKKITGALSVYGLVSKGFSPPTVAELLPSTSVINTELQAEKGINYELGFRGGLFANRLSLDINAFDFRLQNAITQRRDISGADYFQNAGDTKQQGLEGAVSYQVIRNSDRLVNKLIAWFNYTYQDFHYKNFKQLNNDFSGKQIPSIAPHTVASGIDLDTKPGWYGSLTYYYSDPIALNDANSDFASSYNLLGFRTGIRKSFGNRLKADIFISGDNLLNEKYSLGNDINAAGSRFYNTAAGVNYQAGVSLQYVSK